MKRICACMYYEFLYLFRQKFLWLFILIGVLIIGFRMPRFKYNFNYDAFRLSYEMLTEREKMIVDYWEEKKEETVKQRKQLADRATEEKSRLSEESSYEREYFTKIEEYYSNSLKLEVQDYLGWEIFFLHQTSMSPHSPIGLLAIIIISSAGLMLLTKDSENKTLFWASFTGQGTNAVVFFLKLIVTFFYGILVQLVYNIVYILGLWLIVGLDMRHWFQLIQNIPQYRMCDLKLTILEVCTVDIAFKCCIAIFVVLFVALFAILVRRYLFMFLGAIGINGILYYAFFVINEEKNYDLIWRMNPFSVFQLDKFLQYHAIKIENHAIDARLFICVLWGIVSLGLLTISYQIWRRYLYGRT